MSQFVGVDRTSFNDTNSSVLASANCTARGFEVANIATPNTALDCLYRAATPIDFSNVFNSQYQANPLPKLVWCGDRGGVCCNPTLSGNDTEYLNGCQQFLDPTSQQTSGNTAWTQVPVGCCAFYTGNNTNKIYTNPNNSCLTMNNLNQSLLSILSGKPVTNNNPVQLCLVDQLPNPQTYSRATRTQVCRPLTDDEIWTIAGEGCYDWSAQKQDILADATALICPRYGQSVTSSYTSPMSRFNSKSTYPYQPLDAACCAGVGTDCPATACFESPYCIDLLYQKCSLEVVNPLSDGICAAWQAFGRQVTTAHQNGQYNVSADVATRVSLDYCRSVNFTNRELCAGLSSLEGFLYDRLTPALSVGGTTTVGSLTTIVRVQNASGRSVSNVNVMVQSVNAIVTMDATPSLLSFDPWGFQHVTVTYDTTNQNMYQYSFSATHTTVIGGINVTPNSWCSMSTDAQMTRAPMPEEYPVLHDCADGDVLVSNATYTGPLTTLTVSYNGNNCTEAYSRYTRCANCYNFGGWVRNCKGGARPIQYYASECDDSSQHACPFCYIPGDPTNTLTNRYLMQKGMHTYLPPYQTNPYQGGNIGNDNELGCGCIGEEVSCGGPYGGHQGQCSNQTLATYMLGSTRVCAGIDATITVLFSTRTDLGALDFPIMGGFIAAYQPTGLSMDGSSFQVVVYPYNTSFT